MSKFIASKLRGFSLVELMVVVAIIGILSAVAVPNFQKYQAKSKSSEAKVQLASVYTAEVGFSADFSVFAMCLLNMGYDPRPDIANRYYAIGFATAIGTTPGVTATLNGAGTCTDAVANDITAYAAGKRSSAASAATTANIPATALTSTTFTAGAGGNVQTANWDQWTITETKQIRQTSTGY